MEAVAEAGPGADANPHVANIIPGTANLSNEKQGNGATTSPSDSSDIVAKPKTGDPQAPPRSKLKTVLIMASLCVSYLHLGNPKLVECF